jgi:hypothetical protein
LRSRKRVVRLALTVWRLGYVRQRSAGQGSELSRERVGPCASRRRAVEKGARPYALGHARLLAEQVVADLLAALRGELARLPRREHGKGRMGAVMHRALLDAEQLGDLGVALAPAQEQRQRGVLVGWEIV